MTDFPSLDLIKRKSADAGAAHRGYVLMMLIRPVGPYLAWLALRLHLTPRHVTYASLVFAGVIVATAAAGGPRGPLAACVMVLIWEAIDVTDGTMARALGKRDNFGGFLDYASGMFIVAFLPLALGIGLFRWPDGSLHPVGAAVGFTVLPVVLLASGACISVISLLMRLVNRVLFLRFGDSYSAWDKVGRLEARSIRAWIDLFVRNLETPGGLQALVLALAALAGMTEVALAGYLLFYVALLGLFMLQTYRTYGSREEYYDVEIRRCEVPDPSADRVR